MPNVGTFEITLCKILTFVENSHFLAGTTALTSGTLVVEVFAVGINQTKIEDVGNFTVGPGVMFRSLGSGKGGVVGNGTCSSNGYQYFFFETSGCRTYGLRLTPGPTTKVAIFTKWSNDKNTTNADFTFGISSYQSLQISENYGVISTCNANLSVLVLRVQCYADGPGPFSFFANTMDTSWDIQPLSKLTIWDATFSLLNTAILGLGNSQYNCSSYDTTCDSIFPTHPTYAQPFLPILPKAIQSRIFSWLEIKTIYSQLSPSTNIQSDYERLYPTVKNNQLKYFIVLSATSADGALVQFHSPDSLANATLQIQGI